LWPEWGSGWSDWGVRESIEDVDFSVVVFRELEL
jgi:hypothetical protein